MTCSAYLHVRPHRPARRHRPGTARSRTSRGAICAQSAARRSPPSGRRPADPARFCTPPGRFRTAARRSWARPDRARRARACPARPARTVAARPARPGRAGSAAVRWRPHRPAGTGRPPQDLGMWGAVLVPVRHPAAAAAALHWRRWHRSPRPGSTLHPDCLELFRGEVIKRESSELEAQTHRSRTGLPWLTMVDALEQLSE